MSGMRSGNQSAAKGNRSKGQRSASLGQRSKGGKKNSPDTVTGGGGAGGPKKKSSSVMRESTWNNMSKGVLMKEYGTTSYAKYKAGKKSTNVGGTSRTNLQMRGTGDNKG